MDPWYKIALPRKEVREGRSFNPDEFAIALEQVVAGTAPQDYREPAKFFARTYFTRALREHAGMVLKRLSGQTENTPPVLTLITQFGGGKTHTLTALYHLARNGPKACVYAGVEDVLKEAGLAEVPEAATAVFVGNAWDPGEGRENPWIDVAWQLAREKGVAALGASAKSVPPGTDALGRLFAAVGRPVLVLFDEVLNFVNRHAALADPLYAFLQNLTVAMTGTTHGAAVISLPRSQVEMTERDIQWQSRITKIVRRVAKDLIANDETEISEVIRRRLFEELGNERTRKGVAKAYADWCFERRVQLPPEWTAVDTATTEAKSREFLQRRFEACFPFHPATLSVFQRKWQALSQYQQTRGTLAMLAQWISCAYREGYSKARRESLITLGSAPLDVPGFRGVVLGQLGETRLGAAIDADIAGENAHAKALDADTKGPLKDIHRRVGAAILFESSGGQVDKVAYITELRFALGEPEMDTTSVDSAARALESKAFFISRVGSDGFKIYHKATIRKAVADRRASLDEETEIRPVMRDVVKKEFSKGLTIPWVPLPEDGAAVQDSPKLTLVVMDPEREWSGDEIRRQIAEWTRQRGKSPRLHPGALLWCFKRPGRDLRDKVELWLAWKRVAKEMADGTLGADYDRSDRAEVDARVRDAEEQAKDEVWGGYRFVVLADAKEPDGLTVIDLGAGHASASEALCLRVLAALKSSALLNESFGAGYIDRKWPEAFKASGAWPLTSLRQSFLNGALTRLIDPDAVLRAKVVEFVERGDLGLASGERSDDTYDRVWFAQPIGSEEVAFEPGVFLLTKARAKALKSAPVTTPEELPQSPIEPGPTSRRVTPEPEEPSRDDKLAPQTNVLRVAGAIQPEIWNRLGTKLLPKLRSGRDLKIDVEFSVTVDSTTASSLEADLRQALEDLGISGQVRVTRDD